MFRKGVLAQKKGGGEQAEPESPEVAKAVVERGAKGTQRCLL